MAILARLKPVMLFVISAAKISALLEQSEQNALPQPLVNLRGGSDG
jgi:hypothetical protein